MKYNRKFARSQWRKSFGDSQSFTRQRRNMPFRVFTGRCQN